MRKLIGIIGILGLLGLSGCKPNNPSTYRGLPKTYETAYQQIYGHCYDSLPNVAVVALDLYSEGLTLDEHKKIHGTGYNLYLSDIFVPDSLLEQGSYRSDTTGKAFTFLPGRDFEGYPHGMYILNIEEDKVLQIQVLDSGSFVYQKDTLIFQLYFRNSYGYNTTYKCAFCGQLQPWLKR